MSDPIVFEEMVEREDGWCDWVHPLPGYLMKCCDCGLVHEVEVAVARPVETLSNGSFTWEDVQSPEARVMWRMRRSAPDATCADCGVAFGMHRADCKATTANSVDTERSEVHHKTGDKS